jgi:hypothetical protein
MLSADTNLKDEWILVEKHVDSSQRGYIPSSYVQVLPDSEAGKYIALPSSAGTPGATPAAKSAASAFMSSSKYPSAAKTLATPTTVQATPARSIPASASQPAPFTSSKNLGSASTAGDSFAEMFARHEQYFKQVMRQREETFRKLETSITAASREMSECQEKNSQLSNRINDLDTMIEEERRKWRERLDHEKKQLLNRSFAQTTTATPR